jgi:hypothetical protein
VRLWSVEITGPDGQVFATALSDLLVRREPRDQRFDPESADLLAVIGMTRENVIADWSARRFS